jgi:prefoldin subunit 5
MGYGVGSKNLYRYNTVLSDLQRQIKELEQEIAELEGLLSGQSPRRSVGIVPMDW